MSAKGRGLSLAFIPEWGNTESRRDALWQGDLTQFTDQLTNGEADDPTSDLRYHLDIRYGIAIPALGSQAMLTPFATSSGDDRVGLGSDFSLGDYLTAGYEWLPAHDPDGEGDNRLFLHYRREF